MIDKPTFMSKTCRSIIDHICTNLILINQVTLTVIYEDISDQLLVFSELKTKTPKTLNFSSKVRQLTQVKIDIFLKDLSNSHNCSSVANDISLNTVITLLSNLTNHPFPKKILSCKQYKTAQNSWITTEVLAIIKHKNKLYYRYVTTT